MNKNTSVHDKSGPVPLSWRQTIGKEVKLRYEEFVEKVSFEPGVKEWGVIDDDSGDDDRFATAVKSD